MNINLSKEAKATLAVAVANTVFGFSFVFSKIALGYASPMVLLANRFLIAFLAMNIVLLTGKVKLSFGGKKLWKLGVLALFQPILYFIFELYGIQETNSTFSSVMIALVPVVSLFSAIFVLKELPTILQVVCSIVSIGGVVIMALQGNDSGTVTLLGIILLIGAVVTAVGYNITSRAIAGEFTPFERTYAMFFLSAIVFNVIALVENITNPALVFAPMMNLHYIIGLVFLGIMSSVVAFFLMNYANTYLPVARTTSFSNLTTVISVFAGVVFLREPLTYLSVIASVMIVAGVWGVQKFSRKIKKGLDKR